MKNKPGRYGILIRSLADAQFRYFCNLKLYRGSDETVPIEERSTEGLVLEMVRPYWKSGRNLTVDRYYTSVNLAKKLWELELTLTGTLQTNRRNISEEAKYFRGRELYSNLFFYHHFGNNGLLTCLSYIPKQKFVLLLLSTTHVEPNIPPIDTKGRPNTKCKSEMNLFYNSTKSGVDVLDYMCRVYTAKRGTKRWTTSLFGTLIDMAAINTQTCCQRIDHERAEAKMEKMVIPRRAKYRQDFLIHLALELAIPFVQRRSTYGMNVLYLQAMNCVLKEANVFRDQNEQLPYIGGKLEVDKTTPQALANAALIQAQNKAIAANQEQEPQERQRLGRRQPSQEQP